MKKLLFLTAIFCSSFALNAQTGIDEDFDKMREQMRKSMEGMMQLFEGSIDMAEGPIMKMDTFFFKNFGDLDENGEIVPNEEMQSFFNDMEKMMKEQFGNLDLGEMMPFDDTPAIPGPDDMEESEEPKPKKESTPAKNKKKRKTYSL